MVARDGSRDVGSARHETTAERYDRNFGELLQELRVVQTGTQVLFAFLLSIAFTRVFQDSNGYLHAAYVATLLLTVLATGLLVAPAAYHRQHFQRGVKNEVVLVSHRLARAGLLTLALAISGAVLVALMIVLDDPWHSVVAGCVLVVLLGLWFAIPSLRRTPDDEEETS